MVWHPCLCQDGTCGTPHGVQGAHLAGTGDLDGTLRAGAALHEIAAAAGLVHQSEAVERTHHAAVARVHHPLRGIALACAPAGESIKTQTSMHALELRHK